MWRVHVSLLSCIVLARSRPSVFQDTLRLGFRVVDEYKQMYKPSVPVLAHCDYRFAATSLALLPLSSEGVSDPSTYT
jgi:hypothetical protein